MDFKLARLHYMRCPQYTARFKATTHPKQMFIRHSSQSLTVIEIVY